ncbi:MAG: hypothetical protein U0412_03985 [Nitrospira sp.]
MHDKAAVARRIRDAFRDTEHPGAAYLVGSRQGCEPEEVVAPFKGYAHWSLVDPALLDPNDTALSFFTEGGFRHFLPAFLLADLDGRLQTADPVFHLTHGLASDVTIDVPAGGRVHRRTTGPSTLVNPRLYGAMTFRDSALRRLSVFTREEAGAIVDYLEYKRALQPHAADEIARALDNYWYKRAAEAPTREALSRHLQAEAEFAADLMNKPPAS